jgi:Multiubiquitin
MVPSNAGGEGNQSGHFTVIVNGRQKEISHQHVTFEQAIKLAFDPVPTGPNVVFTVTYRNAEKPTEGSLVKGGEPVLVKVSGTIFDVQHSNKS